MDLQVFLGKANDINDSSVRFWPTAVIRQWYRVPAQIYHFSYVIKQEVIMLFSIDLNQER